MKKYILLGLLLAVAAPVRADTLAYYLNGYFASLNWVGPTQNYSTTNLIYDAGFSVTFTYGGTITVDFPVTGSGNGANWLYWNTNAITTVPDGTTPSASFNLSIDEGYMLNLNSLKFELGGAVGAGSLSTDVVCGYSVFVDYDDGNGWVEFQHVPNAYTLLQGTTQGSYTFGIVNIDLSSIQHHTNRNIGFQVALYSDYTGDDAVALLSEIVLDGEIVPIPESSTSLLLATAFGLSLIKRKRRR